MRLLKIEDLISTLTPQTLISKVRELINNHNELEDDLTSTKTELGELITDCLSLKRDHTVEVVDPDLNTLLADKTYSCSGTIKNVPVPTNFCIMEVYDTGQEANGTIVQECHVPQADNTNRIFSRVVVNGTAFGEWRELARTESPTFIGVPTAPTAPTGTSTEQVATTSFVSQAIDNAETIPVGDVVFRPYLRAGYVKADGATVNRASYPSLVAFATTYKLWTTNPAAEPWKFGTGDGSTTMVLPNYKERVVQGGTTPAKREAGLPNITGNFVLSSDSTAEQMKGAFVRGASVGRYAGDRDNNAMDISFNASRSSPIYGRSSTVQPASIVLIPQMKY